MLATASRYVEETDLPIAMVVSEGQHIEYAFLSDELKDIVTSLGQRKARPFRLSRQQHSTVIRRMSVMRIARNTSQT